MTRRAHAPLVPIAMNLEAAPPDGRVSDLLGPQAKVAGLAAACLPDRTPWQGMLQILRYNRRHYLGAVGGALFLAWLAWMSGPTWTRIAALALAFLLVAGAIVSLAVSHWVYDRSGLHRWDWLVARVPAPAEWAVVHAGLDEASPALRRIYPGAIGHVVDIYDAATMTEPAIRVARKTASSTASMRARHDRLPMDGESVHLGLLFFAAHELRRTHERNALLVEMRRALAHDGRLVVVEHLRDLPNLLAFGPGALHFFARRHWLRSFGAAGLAVEREDRITPFVRAFFLRRAP